MHRILSPARLVLVALPLLAAAAVIYTTEAADPPRYNVVGNAVDLIMIDMSFDKTVAEKGLDGWMSFFAKDAVIFPSKGPIVEGADKIRARYAETGWTPKGLRWKPVRASISDSGDLGYTYGTWKWTGTDKDGKPVTMTGKYVTIWRRQADKSWKVVLDTGTEDKN